MNVLNRSEKQDIATRIDNVEGAVQPQVGVWEMNYPDIFFIMAYTTRAMYIARRLQLQKPKALLRWKSWN